MAGEGPAAVGRLERRRTGPGAVPRARSRARSSPSTGCEFGRRPWPTASCRSGFFGILAEPEGPPEAPEPVRTDTCVVFLNAGAVRRMGPNRMWVEAARRWAANGVPTVRVDVEGIGDATGDAAQYVDLGQLLQAGTAAPRQRDHRRARGPRAGAAVRPDRPVCRRLCRVQHRCHRSARHRGHSPSTPDCSSGIPRSSCVAMRASPPRSSSSGSWQRILSGETTPARMLEIGRAAAAEAPRAARRYASRLRGERRREPWADRLDGVLGTLREADTRVVLAFAGDEPMYDDLKAAGVLDRLGQWPNVVLTDLPGDDHTLRPIAAQRAFHQLIDRELDGLVNGPRVARAGRLDARAVTARGGPSARLRRPTGSRRMVVWPMSNSRYSSASGRALSLSWAARPYATGSVSSARPCTIRTGLSRSRSGDDDVGQHLRRRAGRSCTRRPRPSPAP